MTEMRNIEGELNYKANKVTSKAEDITGKILLNNE